MPDFVPSASQLRFLDATLVSPGYRISELCKAADISRTTYYRWCQDPDFLRWYAGAWSAQIMCDGAALIQQARDDSHRSYSYWKAMFDLTFDPRGLGLLQQWRQRIVANATAETPAPQAGAGVTLPAESNQQLNPPQRDKQALAPTPLRHVRLIRRAQQRIVDANAAGATAKLIAEAKIVCAQAKALNAGYAPASTSMNELTENTARPKPASP